MVLISEVEKIRGAALELVGAKAALEEAIDDKISGTKAARPGLDKLLDQLRKGDTLVVTKLDRLGRSLPHLVQVVGDLKERGVHFKSLGESIDTSTSVGKLVFRLFASLAEFERDLIQERTKAGLAAARARGRKGGRPKLMTKQKIKMARSLHKAQELTVDEICDQLGVHRSMFYRYLDDRAS